MAFNELPEELGFEPGDHAVRIERPPWVSWVRGVRRYESFTRGGFDGSATDLVGLLLTLVAGLLVVIFVLIRERRARGPYSVSTSMLQMYHPLVSKA